MSNIQLLATKDAQPYEVPFKAWKFPAGEIGVQLLDIEGVDFNGCSIMWKYTGDNDDLMRVLQLRDAIYNVSSNAAVSLVIPYLPYSRQDRVCHQGESNALNIFMSILTENFWDVYTFDVHNEKAFLDCAGTCKLVNIGQEVCASNLPKYDYFIAPDDGAAKKIYKHRQVNYADNPTKVIVMKKTRVDGKVIYEDLPHGTIPVGSKVCVVDDLSDGNGTFIAIASAVKDKPNLESFDLYVTHGLFTKGLDNIRDLYGKVYVCNLVNESLKNDPLLEIFNSPRT